jgi:V/A-type H+-transporting ATPase subunit A
LISWSKYKSFLDGRQKERGHGILRKGNEVAQMMKVVGEEGTSLSDYVDHLKAEFFDFVYLQQNAFDAVDEATPKERQMYVFDFIYRILESEFIFEDKDKALHFFQKLRQLFKGWNSAPWQSEEFEKTEKEIRVFLPEGLKKG